MIKIYRKGKDGKTYAINIPTWDDYAVPTTSPGSYDDQSSDEPVEESVPDSIGLLLTTTSASYSLETPGNWVKVTKTEYDNVAANLDGVSKIGNNDTEINTRSVATSYMNADIAFGTGSTPAFSISTGQYVVGYISEAWNSVGTSQLGYTTTFAVNGGSGVTTIGNSTVTVGGVRDYYIRKKPSDPATETRYPTLRMSVSPNAVLGSSGYRTTNNGANWLVNVNNATAKIQLLVTSTKSW